MIYGSVCSGIEAASVAWHPLGWRSAFFAEIDAFPRAVLAHHYPDVPLHGDFTTIEAGQYAAIDVLVGGTPCQSFSVAGLRKGLADDRGNLALEFLRLAQRLRPEWVVWENVPGVLSSNGGRDFGAFLGGLVECGYGFAYRVLDAQYFGLAQRRKRVFVVGRLGDWRGPVAVLFERAGLRGDPAPGREARQGAAAGTLRSTDGGLDCDHAAAGHLVAGTIGTTSGDWSRDNIGEGLITLALRGEGFDASEDGTGRGTPLVPVAFSCKDHGADAGDVAPTLRAMGHGDSHANAGGQVAVAFEARFARNGRGAPDEVVPPLKAQSGTTGKGDAAPLVAFHNRQDPDISGDVTHPLGAKDNGLGLGMLVRRLTPRECERLQGFPDDYTLIPYRGKPAADGPRYKALGNSMAVPVMRWIGRRIEAASNLLREQEAA